jgi:hypothetical protein
VFTFIIYSQRYAFCKDIPLLFLLAFAFPFLRAALGKRRKSSGVKEVLEEGFVLACVLLEGPGSGE